MMQYLTMQVNQKTIRFILIKISLYLLFDNIIESATVDMISILEQTIYYLII